MNISSISAELATQQESNSGTCANKSTHLMILVHGLFGNDKELDYLQESIEEQKASTDHDLIIYSAKCNIGKTSDGIENGGRRLAREVKDQIEKINGKVLLSFVGNSLGGLYARYAITVLDLTEITPFIFCTIATPHLGVSNNTYIPLPRWGETLIGSTMQKTGEDLFSLNSMVEDMGTKDHFLERLRSFRKRIALANCFGTDFQVPTTTAAFLSYGSYYKHNRLPEKEKYFLSFETKPDQDYNKDSMSQSLDALGWTKIFLDVRNDIPLFSVPLPFSGSNSDEVPTAESLTSAELIPLVTNIGQRWSFPFGHTVSCANSKNSFTRWINSNGQHIMDQLAEDLMLVMVQDHPQECIVNEQE